MASGTTTNMPYTIIYAVTMVATFSNGIATVDISSLGLSSKPKLVSATPCTLDMIKYNYDNSTTDTLQFDGYFYNGSRPSGLQRFTLIIMK